MCGEVTAAALFIRQWKLHFSLACGNVVLVNVNVLRVVLSRTDSRLVFIKVSLISLSFAMLYCDVTDL